MASPRASLQGGGPTAPPWSCQPARRVSRASCVSSPCNVARSHSWFQCWRCAASRLFLLNGSPPLGSRSPAVLAVVRLAALSHMPPMSLQPTH
eukprot:7263527-Alexandrium_andersonii.AAC.1